MSAPAVVPPPPPPPPLPDAPPLPSPPPLPATTTSLPEPQTQPEAPAPVTTSAVESGVKSWERPWSIIELREDSSQWTLASDAGLLLYLRKFSENMKSKTHELEKQVDTLLFEAKGTDTRMNNVINDFLMLSNIQFVENRVWDEADKEKEESKEKTEQEKQQEMEKAKEERTAEISGRIKNALTCGLKVLDEAFETIEIDPGEDEDDLEGSYSASYAAEPLLEPRDPYSLRSLPHRIGTGLFLSEDTIGLTENASDSEEEALGGLYDTDEEPTPEITGGLADDDTDASDGLFQSSESEDLLSDVEPTTGGGLMGSSEETDTTESESEPQGLQAELAARLGVGRHGSGSEGEGETKKKKKKKRKKDKAGTSQPKSTSDDLFSVDVDSDNEGGGGLFGGTGVKFDQDDEEDEISIKTGTSGAGSSSPKRKSSAKKRPAGAVPMFGGGGGGGLFEESDSEPEESGDRPGPAPQSSGGIFGESDDEDWTKPAEKTPPADKKKKKPVGGVSMFRESAESAPSGGGGLFDSLSPEDDQGQLFPGDEPPKPVKQESVQKSSNSLSGGLFSEEDEGLFDEPPPKTTPPPQQKKKKPAGAVSLFGGADLFGTSAGSNKSPADSKENGGDDIFNFSPPSKKNKSSGKSSGLSHSLFDQQDEGGDLFSQPSKPSKPSKQESSSKPVADDLFADLDSPDNDDGFFTTSQSKPPASNQKPPSKDALFDNKTEQSDALFTEPLSSTMAQPRSNGLFEEPAEKTPPSTTRPRAPTDDLFGGSGEVKKDPPNPKKESSDLFGDDLSEDEMFSTKSVTKPSKTTSSGSRSKAKDDLFGDSFNDSKPDKKSSSDDLFDEPLSVKKEPVKATPKDDSEDDLFGDSLPKTQPVKTSKKVEAEDDLFGKAVAKKEPVKPTSKDKDDLFGESFPKPSKTQSKPPSDDLFGDSIEVKKEPPKPATKPVTRDPLFTNSIEKSKDDVLTSSIPKTSKETKPQEPPVVKAKPAKQKEGGLFDDDSDEDLFASKPKPAPQQQPSQTQSKWKPVGAVSVFGGVDPFGASGLKSPSSPASKDAVFEDSPDLPAPKKEPPPVTSKPSRMSTSSLETAAPSKLKVGLNIDPLALKPGAAPPTKAPTELSLSFDEPVVVNPLESLTKNRVQRQRGKRPPTRKSRASNSTQSPASPVTNSLSANLEQEIANETGLFSSTKTVSKIAVDDIFSSSPPSLPQLPDPAPVTKPTVPKEPTKPPEKSIFDEPLDNVFNPAAAPVDNSVADIFGSPAKDSPLKKDPFEATDGNKVPSSGVTKKAAVKTGKAARPDDELIGNTDDIFGDVPKQSPKVKKAKKKSTKDGGESKPKKKKKAKKPTEDTDLFNSPSIFD